MRRVLVIIGLLGMEGCVSTLSCGVTEDGSYVEVTGTGSMREYSALCGFNTTD